MYFVYIIRCDDNSLYTGITNDLERRINEHFTKSPRAAAYTKSRNVVSLEAVWQAENRSDASKLEYRIKKLSKSKKEELINNPWSLETYSVYDFKDEIVLS